ncbi:30S ribosomal protein S16, partial [Nocardia sp. BSTN01]|nr:30S ribosomal protein S16 [Nocardia sp. BSTN01]
TEPVKRLLEITDDWQKFKGLPGAEGTLKVKAAKPSKLDLFNAALAAADSEPVAEAVTPKKKKSKAAEGEGEAEAATEAAE